MADNIPYRSFGGGNVGGSNGDRRPKTMHVCVSYRAMRRDATRNLFIIARERLRTCRYHCQYSSPFTARMWLLSWAFRKLCYFPQIRLITRIRWPMTENSFTCATHTCVQVLSKARIFCVDMNDAMLDKACYFRASSVVVVNRRACSSGA